MLLSIEMFTSIPGLYIPWEVSIAMVTAADVIQSMSLGLMGSALSFFPISPFRLHQNLSTRSESTWLENDHFISNLCCFLMNLLHGKPCKYDTVKTSWIFLDGCRLLFFLWLLIKFSVMSPRGMLITLAPYLQGGLVSKVYIYTWTAGIYLYQGEQSERNVFRKCSADICMSCSLAHNELFVPYYYTFLCTFPA